MIAEEVRLQQPQEDLLRASPLGTLGGAAVARLLDDHSLARLAREAFACHPQALEQRIQRDRDSQGRRGDPNRWLESATGGPALQGFYASQTVLDTLAALTGVRWRTAGGLGSFSYYRRAGHHLGLHRDLDICELAVITCVYDDAPAQGVSGGRSGVLRLHPHRSGDSLETIAADSDSGIDVRLKLGDSLVLLGGLVPHQLMPMSARHNRIVTPLCYQVDAFGLPHSS